LESRLDTGCFQLTSILPDNQVGGKGLAAAGTDLAAAGTDPAAAGTDPAAAGTDRAAVGKDLDRAVVGKDLDRAVVAEVDSVGKDPASMVVDIDMVYTQEPVEGGLGVEEVEEVEVCHHMQM
jgi:hypothetical protein